MRLLVTGATGFIGRHCLPRLTAAGFDLHCVSSHPRADFPQVGRWYLYDLRDEAQCRAAIDEIRPTHLLHLAWIATPGAFWHSPENNPWLAGSRALFRAFYARGGKRALGLGSCAEYPASNGSLAEHCAQADPATLYGRCKAAAWQACRDEAARVGAEAVWARLFHPYGPGEPPDRVFPTVIRSLLQGRAVDCTAGEQVRDFIYVDDVADGLVALLASRLQGAYNLGTGQATPLRVALGLIGSVMRRPELIRLGALSPRREDPAYLVADMAKLAGALAWRAAVPLPQGIRKTIGAWRKELP